MDILYQPDHSRRCYKCFIAYWQVVHGSYLRSGRLEFSKNRATYRSYTPYSYGSLWGILHFIQMTFYFLNKVEDDVDLQNDTSSL